MFSLLFTILVIFWRKRDKTEKKSKTFIHERYIFSHECNEMFRVEAKIRVGRETGNRYNFVWPQCCTRIYYMHA